MIALLLLAYCGSLAAGLWWRITQAEERLARKQAQEHLMEEIREDIPAAKPAGRVMYAWRREDDYCGEGYGE